MQSYKRAKAVNLMKQTPQSTMKYTTIILSVVILASAVHADQHTDADSFRDALENAGLNAPDSKTIWPLATHVIESVQPKRGGVAFSEAWKSTRYLAFCDYYVLNHSDKFKALVDICTQHRDALIKHGDTELERTLEEFGEYNFHSPVGKKAFSELRYLYNLFIEDPNKEDNTKKVVLKCNANDDANKLTHCIIKEGIVQWHEDFKHKDSFKKIIEDANAHAKEFGASPEDIE